LGPGFVLAIWMLFALFCGVVWIAMVVAFIAGVRRRIRWLRWLSGYFVVGIPVAGIVIGGLNAYFLICSRNPTWVYTKTFHERPSSDVSDLRSELFWFADTGHVRLRFHAHRSTFDRILPKDMRLASDAEARMDTSCGFSREDREAWNGVLGSQAEAFVPSPGSLRRGFASERTSMYYDPESSTVVYCFTGID
jgi:hypothetical protein